MKTAFIPFCIKLLLLYPAALWGQRECATVSNNDYYDFYNNYRKDDSTRTFVLSDLPATASLMDDTSMIFSDSIFSKDDITFFYLQLNNHKTINWSTGNIRGSRIVAESKLKKIFSYKHRSISYDSWKKFRRKYGNTGIARYSIPLFSCNKEYCIIYTSWSCGGLCGDASTNLYKKINGKWTWIKWYSLAIS